MNPVTTLALLMGTILSVLMTVVCLCASVYHATNNNFVTGIFMAGVAGAWCVSLIIYFKIYESVR